jgi:TATA-binding protein-associated factor
MAGGLLSACGGDDPADADARIGRQLGQDVIDSLSVLEAVVPALHGELGPRLVELFPRMLVALRSRYAVIRQSAARCFATVCSVLTVDGMRYVIENVIPLLGDALSLSNRQGAAELIYRKCLSEDVEIFLMNLQISSRNLISRPCLMLSSWSFLSLGV